MTFPSFFLILRRQFAHKWGRFLLASGGIMIGIWAITLTTGLSLGLRDTFVTAINSRPDSTQILMTKTEGGQSSFVITNPNEQPKSFPLSLNDLEKLKQDVPGIENIVPYTSLDSFLLSNGKTTSNCQDIQNQVNQALAQDISSSDVNKNKEDCKNIHISTNIFAFFYADNKDNWIGKTTEPNDNEIVSCFKCGELELDKKLSVSKPEEMIGKKITLEFTGTPKIYPLGKAADITQDLSSVQPLEKSIIKQFTISSVVDDTKDISGIFTPTNLAFYLNFNNFDNLVKQNKWDFDKNNAGYLRHQIKIQSFDKVDLVLNKLKEMKYDAESPIKFILDGVNTVFYILTIALSLFGFIALIASIFGIINVMTISVLERKKEIGILKSLGARNGDIFRLFLLESAIIGFVGWLLGTLLAMGIGALISFIARQIVLSDPKWKSSLETLNINYLGPSFPWWLLGGTLLIALTFTLLSGILPSLNAARQNPVDVLRSE